MRVRTARGGAGGIPTAVAPCTPRVHGGAHSLSCWPPTSGCLGAADPLVADAAFLGLSATELVAQLEAEWQQRGHLGIWVLGPGLAARTCAVPAPAAFWWLMGAAGAPSVDDCGRSGAGGRLAAADSAALDVAVLRADQRQATVLLADWVRGLILQAGSVAAGIGYDSRHATGAALSYWLVVSLATTMTAPPTLNRSPRWRGSGPLPSPTRTCRASRHVSSSRSGDHHTTRYW